jgi:hypothetical protein
MSIAPRYVRLHDAPEYIGMDKNLFNAEVRPFLIEIPIGARSVAFDRLDLDAWADEYKARNGRPGRKMKEATTCEQGQGAFKPPQTAARPSTSGTRADGFSDASEMSARPKQKLGLKTSRTKSTSKVDDVLNACFAMQRRNT